MELVDRSQLGDFQNLKGKYEWLLRLDDDKLSNEVIYHDTVQTALSELLRFVDDVANFPELHFGADGEPFDPRMETSDEWLDMN